MDKHGKKSALRATMEQEIKSHQHWLTKAEAAESSGNEALAEECRFCANLCYVQATYAESTLAEIEAREEEEYQKLLDDATWRERIGDGVYAK